MAIEGVDSLKSAIRAMMLVTVLISTSFAQSIRIDSLTRPNAS